MSDIIKEISISEKEFTENDYKRLKAAMKKIAIVICIRQFTFW